MFSITLNVAASNHTTMVTIDVIDAYRPYVLVQVPRVVPDTHIPEVGYQNDRK